MKTTRSSLLLLGLLTVATLGCKLSLLELSTPGAQTPLAATQSPTATPQPMAEVTFHALVPDDTPSNASLAVEIVDEVTGVGLNLSRFPMQAMDVRTYNAVATFPVGSVVRYRYVRQGAAPAQEATPLGEAVRYRMVVVQGPTLVEDRIARWSDGDYNGGTGTLSGQALDAATGQPLPGLMVLIGGRRTFTRADGSFHLNSLAPGKHTLVVYDPTGQVQPFQQGAVIEEGLVTPATLMLNRAPLVSVTFQVHPPKDHVAGAPIRLAGNLYTLGNTFADLAVGESTLASRMPVLQPQADGTYTLVLNLPAGTDLRYKYTLGDGFWNAERDAEGHFVIRQLIVPADNTVVHDQIVSWRSGQAAPIFFDLHVTANTPPGEAISLQLNPGLWMEPIPMWPLGADQWGYQLYGPFDVMDHFSYRFCRNAACDLAAEATQSGQTALGHPVEPRLVGQHLVDQVTAWQNWQGWPSPIVQMGEVQPRAATFVRGVSWLPSYRPGDQSTYPAALQRLAEGGASTLILSPTWTFTFAQPLNFDPQPGEDMLWPDLQATLDAAREAGLQVALYPQPRFAGGADVWWSHAPRDLAWWEAWFEAYAAFARHHALLAEQYHLPYLILGGPAVAPALPEGTLADGTPSGVPANAADRWRRILTEVQTDFSGQVWWAMPMPQEPTATPPFVDALDGLYLHFALPLSDHPQADLAAMSEQAVAWLDGLVLPFQVHADRPIWLALDYPSAEGGATGCITGPNGCLDPLRLTPYLAASQGLKVDLDVQATAYNALLLAVNDRDWIGGVVSDGYFPPLALQDASLSVHGKPAEQVLWAWFRHWRGP